MVTSSAVVGSSHEDQPAARTRARSRSSPAGACRRRARAGRRAPAAPGRGCRPGASARAPARAPAARLWPRCTCGPSAIWSPTRMTGLSAVIGSWKIIAIAAPRTSRSRLADARHEVLAVEQDLAADDLARAGQEARGSRAASCSCRSRTRRRGRAPRPAATLEATPRRPRAPSRGASGMLDAQVAHSRMAASLIGPQQVGEPVADQREPEAGDDDRDAGDRGRAASSW